MNTKFKGTPGPWEFVPPSQREWHERNEKDLGGIRNSEGEWVCTFGDSTQYYPSEGEPPGEADAHLITTAPDLLEALELLLHDRTPWTVKCAKEAIAKALGKE